MDCQCAGGLAGQLIFGTVQILSRLCGSAGILVIYSQVTGWIPYFVGSLAMGLGFAVLISNTSLAAETLATSTATGFGYGPLTWVIPLPAVITTGPELFGVPNIPAVQRFDPGSLVRHVVYGLILGIVYPLVRNSDRIDLFS